MARAIERGMMSSKHGNGEGSVFRRHSKGCPPAVDGERPEHKCHAPWRAQITTTDATGKRRLKSADRPTKAEAQEALRLMQADAGRGITRDRRRTVGSWLDEWIDDICEARPPTKDGYRKHARMIQTTIGGIRLAELQPADVRSMHRELARRGLGGTTVHHAHALLRAALNGAVEDRMLDWNPAAVVKAPALAVRQYEQPTEDEARAIRAAARDPREMARVGVAFLALRPSEILALRWDGVHEDADVPHLVISGSLRPVRGGGMQLYPPKTAGSAAPIPLPAWTAESLRMWRIGSGGAGYVFGKPGAPDTPMRTEADNAWWHRLCQRAGVRADLPRYGIRGYVATAVERSGASPRVTADTLRHASANTALRHYIAATPRPQVLAVLEAVIDEARDS